MAMTPEEKKQAQKEAKARWYARNKDYENPNREKVAATARKASLKYYYKHRDNIIAERKNVAKAKMKARRTLKQPEQEPETPFNMMDIFLFPITQSKPVQENGLFFPLR
jgi:hypothetical protein